MQVHFETYTEIAPKIVNNMTIPQFTVEITIGTDRRTVKASGVWNGHVIVHGLAIRFSSGNKVWPGTATYWLASGNINHIRPNIDKSGSFSLIGYAEDYENKSVRSEHNAVI